MSTVVCKPVYLRLASRTGVVVLASLAALTSACAATGYTPRPFPTPSADSARGSAPATIDGYAISETALTLTGKPYRSGGADPAGFDCSGFTQYVFAQHGVALPRAVRDQFEAGQPVKQAELAPGDLMFFATTAHGPTHVAIAIGGDQFVHAPSSTGVVRIERLGAAYWAKRYLGARRLRS